jgi:histidinol-phosphate aminotransferase
MSIRPSVRALARYHFTPRTSPVKLDQNESPYDLPEAVKEAALARMRSGAWQRYPELHPRTLELAIAERHGWDPSGVVVTNGSNVLLQALVIVAGIGQTVVSVTPTFPVYALQARLLGAELVELPLGDDFALPSPERVADAMAGRRGVVFIANPAAPTGNLHPREALQPLLARAGEDWLVVLDEAYCDFAGTDHLDVVASNPAVLSVRTMSKAYALAGSRLGYGLMAPELATEVRKGLLPFSLSSLQSAVALAALEHDDYVHDRVALAVRERERLFSALTAMPGVEAFPSVTNFVLFRVRDAERVYRALLERDVAVRRQDHLPGLEGCLRVSAGAPEETDAFLLALRQALSAEAVGG